MRQLMTGRQQWIAGIILGATLSVLPVWAYALGLGRLVVHSGLDEPLSAEIDLIDPTPQELKSLSPSLASRADFDNVGIDRPEYLSSIKYTIAQHQGGGYYIKLSTDDPIREPFIHTLLQVDWAGGHLIREYTALLDPPHWLAGERPEVEVPAQSETAPATVSPTAEAPASAETAVPPAATSTKTETAATPETAAAEKPAAPPTTTESTTPEAAAPNELLGPSTEATTAAVPEEAPATSSAELPAPAESAAAPSASSWASTSRYTVRKGDTLSGITKNVMVDRSVSPEQVMIALLRVNPNAFFDHNINNLKSGRILKIPGRNVVESVSKASASKEIHVQYDAWQEYKVKLAAASRTVTVPSESPAASGASTQGVVAKTAAPKPQQTEAAAGANNTAGTASGVAGEDLLRIVRSNLDETSAGGGAGKAAGPASAKTEAAGERHALTNNVATLEEQIDAKQLENKELRERVGKMQAQVKNTARLIDIENKELAVTQNQAAKLKPTTAPRAGTSQPAQPATTPAAPKIAPKPFVHHVMAKKPLPQPAVPVSEGSGLFQNLIDGVTGNPMTLILLGGVGVLGVAILLLYYLRRRRATAEFEESILSGGSLNTDGASITDSGSQAAASDTSFLSDFSQGGMGNIHTDEVDPIAEAEVYLAYGRDEQAEEILREAVVKDPQRQELKQKLLEIYHQRNDIVAFETVAEELYAQVEGKGGKVWEKVEEMGRKISPNNPMFRGGAPATKASMAAVGQPAAKAKAPISGPMGAQPPAFSDNDTLRNFTPSVAPASGAGLDFDIEAPSVQPASSAGEVSFDLDLASEPTASATSAATSAFASVPEAPSAPADPGFDLDFNLDDSAPADASGMISFDTAAVSESEPPLDFHTDTAAAPQADDGITFVTDAASESPALEFESVSEEAAESPAAGQSQWDETATKLDLAKAYIDMGDAEGARSILDEVMTEGNESQKNQARELAAQLV